MELSDCDVSDATIIEASDSEFEYTDVINGNTM